MPLPLERTLALLEELAPLRYAQEWDNVGLLLGTLAEGEHAPSVTRVLLTIDLTEAVLEEARAAQAELVVAYHPPLFRPTKRLDAARPSSRVLLRAARAGIAIYSPHTALDAAPGGMNDWLASGLGTGTQAPLIDASVLDPNAELKLVTFVPAEHVDGLRTALALAGAGVIGDYNFCSSQSPTTGTFLGGDTTKPVVGARGQLETVPEVRLEMVCPKHALGRIARALRDAHPYEEPAWDLYPLAPRPAAGFGIGRSLELAEPARLDTLVGRLKLHLGRPGLRVAASWDQRAGAPIRRVAVCAGSGKGVFDQAPGFDLYVTGELPHHSVLALVAEGASVVLGEHSSSERGYLPTFARRLAERAEGALEAIVSEVDREPLESW